MFKRFFEKKRLEMKFKKAGSGHQLNEKPMPSQVSAATTFSRTKSGLSKESSKAAEAALARLNQSKQNEKCVPSMRFKVKSEMEKESKEIEQARAAAAAASSSDHTESSSDSTTTHSLPSMLLFTCPDIGSVVLPKDDMNMYIHQFLLENLAEDPVMASALMIKTLNKSKEKIKACVDVITKYLDNIINNPGEEKYRKIRVENKIFQEKVTPLTGTEEFLQAAGFEKRLMSFQNREELFFVLDEGHAVNKDQLESLRDLLISSEPVKLELSRALKVFHPSVAAAAFEIPEEFYNISPSELKKEKQLQDEAVERLGMLRTKAMREREEMKKLRKYRYTLIRVRFPDGVLLQGTFRATENLSALFQFVKENMVNDWMPFTLATSTGQKLVTEDLSLAQLELAPTALINFAWDQTILNEVIAQKGSVHLAPYLKSEVLCLIQSL